MPKTRNRKRAGDQAASGFELALVDLVPAGDPLDGKLAGFASGDCVGVDPLAGSFADPFADPCLVDCLADPCLSPP